jgi:thiamine pyrophosphokinase
VTEGLSRSHAIVLADGTAPARALLDSAWPAWDAGVSLVIAADGGARHARELGLALDRWVGDGDSIDPAELEALAAAGVPIERVDQEKDASDTELALLAAVEAGADEITILGGLGGTRTDHGIVNVALLEHPALEGRPARLFDERAARISLLVAPARGAGPSGAELTGHVDDLVTLVPWGGPARGVATRGLRYPLAGETLRAGTSRGLSNVRTAPDAWVSLADGRLLVIETPATVPP